MNLTRSLLVVAATAALTCGCKEKIDDSRTVDTTGGARAGAPTSAALEQEEDSAVEDTVIVTVEGKSLTSSMADQMASQMAARQGVPPQMMGAFLAQAGSKLRDQVTDQFIDQVLLEKEAKRRNIAVSDEEVQKVIDDMSQRLPEGMTVEQALTAEGVTMEQVRDDISNNLRLRNMFDAETADVEAISDDKVSAFYNENPDYFKTEEESTARHILIACDSKEDEAAHAKAKAEAEAVRQQLVDGADFGELAIEKSSCPSKDNGGSLGSFGRGQMVPAFEEAAFTQELNAIGPVVGTDFGFHVIQVTDRTAAATQALEEVSEKIREHLLSQARNEDFGAYAKSLRAGATITYASAQE